MSPDLRHFKGTALALLLLLSAPAQVSGEELKLVPSLTGQEEFNDNIVLAVSNQRDDFITTLSPGLLLSGRTGRGGVTLSGGINWLKYARTSGSDSVDYLVNGSGDYLINERLAVSGGASYTQNSRPDQLDPTTGLSINSESRVQSFQAGGSYVATEKSRVSLSYSYRQQEYSLPGYLDSRQHQGATGFSYTLTPQASLEEAFSFNRQLTDVSTVDNYSATMGLSYRFRELWSLSLRAGGRHTRSDLETGGVDGSSTGDWGWVGNLSFIYSGERLNGSVSFDRDVSLAAGRSGSTESTSGSVNLGNRFTEELYGAFNFRYSRNQSNRDQFSVLSIDEDTLDLGCMLRYDINNDLAIEANYHHVAIDYGQFGTRARQNTFMLRLTMRHQWYL